MGSWACSLSFDYFRSTLSSHSYASGSILTVDSLISHVLILGSGVSFPQILQSFLSGILLLNMLSLLLVHLIGSMRLASEDFAHDFILYRVLVNILQDFLVEVILAIEVVDVVASAVFSGFCENDVSWLGRWQFDGLSMFLLPFWWLMLVRAFLFFERLYYLFKQRLFLPFWSQVVVFRNSLSPIFFLLSAPLSRTFSPAIFAELRFRCGSIHAIEHVHIVCFKAGILSRVTDRLNCLIGGHGLSKTHGNIVLVIHALFGNMHSNIKLLQHHSFLFDFLLFLDCWKIVINDPHPCIVN